MKGADVSELEVEAAAAKMMAKPTGQVAIRKYDLEIILVLRRRFMLHDFASIKKAYEDVPLSSPELPGTVEDKMINFVSKVVDVNRQVDASALSTESVEAIIKGPEREDRSAGRDVGRVHVRHDRAQELHDQSIGDGVDAEGDGCSHACRRFHRLQQLGGS